jgi:hypothetical protein
VGLKCQGFNIPSLVVVVCGIAQAMACLLRVVVGEV